MVAMAASRTAVAHDELQETRVRRAARAAVHRVLPHPGAQVGQPRPDAAMGGLSTNAAAAAKGMSMPIIPTPRNKGCVLTKQGNARNNPATRMPARAPVSIRGQDQDEHQRGAPGGDSDSKAGFAMYKAGFASGDIDGEDGDDQSCGRPDELRSVA